MIAILDGGECSNAGEVSSFTVKQKERTILERLENHTEIYNVNIGGKILYKKKLLKTILANGQFDCC